MWNSFKFLQYIGQTVAPIDKFMRDYKITIVSTVDGEKSEYIVYGDVFKEFGYTAVRFEDADSKDPTKIVISEDMITVAREGELTSTLTFEKDKSVNATIQTAYGFLPIGLKTTDLFSNEGENGLDIRLSYLTDFVGVVSRFDIFLRAEKI